MFYLWEYLKTVKKPIVLYGMGNGADLILNELENSGVKINGVFASDGFSKNKCFHGFEVCNYSKLKNSLGDMIVLVAFGSNRPEVLKNVLKIASETELYIPDVPVYGNNIFNRDFLFKNKEKIKFVYNMLADEKSKIVFENILKFKASGKPEYLFNSESDYKKSFEILNLNDSEVYLDLGAYNGDTVLLYTTFKCAYKKIIALEPDKKSYAKLLKNTAHLKNIECLNSGVWCRSGEESFSALGGRNSSMGMGGQNVPVVSIDDLAGNNKISFIKMDVEGSEAAAICGAEKTILNLKPKMQIACYHRSEDIFDIPLRVFNIRKDYKIYIRHQPCFPAWDTNFYFV